MAGKEGKDFVPLDDESLKALSSTCFMTSWHKSIYQDGIHLFWWIKAISKFCDETGHLPELCSRCSTELERRVIRKQNRREQEQQKNIQIHKKHKHAKEIIITKEDLNPSY